MFKWGKRAVDAAAAVINEIRPAEQELARQTLADIEQTQKELAAARDAIHRIIFGQRNVVDQCLITLLAGGHAILVGVPGVAKTTLVETISAAMGLDQKRVQATPDLMPSDILGSEVLDTAPDGTRNFRFIRGPVFCQLLLMDEINRASPRTQAALLQAMQEQRATIAGRNYSLPRPFHVFATQNPLEYEGTYPLPEAQLDRFLMQIDI
nr:AAA family ATPase [Alphaproteobacteria bacterium]